MDEKKDTKNVATGCSVIFALLIGWFVLSFGIAALFTWIIFSLFGWDWSFKIALGIWLLAIAIRWFFRKLAK